MKAKLFILPVLLLLHTSANSQWTRDSVRNTIIKDTVTMQDGSDPRIVSTTGGRSYIVWAENTGNNMGFSYRMQLLDSNGYRLWPANGILIDSMAGSTIFSYDVKTDKEGNALIGLQNTRLGSYVPVIYKVDQQGRMMWGASGIQLTDTAQDGGIYPNICVTDNNNVIVAWAARKGTDEFISAVKITSNGALFWPDNLRITDTVYPSLLSVVSAQGEDFIIQYSEPINMNSAFTTFQYAQRYNNLGQAVWRVPAKISSKEVQAHHLPHTITDGYGGIMTCFVSGNPDNPRLSDVYAQRVYADGHTWDSTGKRLSSGTNVLRFSPASIYVASQNKYFIGICETDGNQNMQGIALQKMDTAGNVLLGVTAPSIYPLASQLIYNGAIADINDGILLQYALQDTSQVSLYAIKVTYNGAVAWQPASIPLSVATSTKRNCVLGSYSNGQVVAVWSDDRMNRGGGIYAQNIRKDGSQGVRPTSVEHHKLASQLVSVYPNPAQQQVTVTLKKSSTGLVTVKLLNLAGQIVLSDRQDLYNTTFNKTYDLSSYPKGTYLLEVSNNKTIERAKVILQ